MTVGKDVSMLFPHVVNCMQTEDLELKKLVYLYLINYAKTQPDLAIMAVNTFVKVCVLKEQLAKLCTVGNQLCNQLCVATAGLTRPQPSDQSPGCENHGLYPCGQDHRVSL